MSKSVADLVNQAMARKRRPDGRAWGPYQLAGAIGLLEGDRPVNVTQVQRLLNDERQTFTHRLIRRLIEVLPFTEEEQDELWKAAGLWPPDLDIAGYRQFRQRATSTDELTNRQLRYDPELVEQIDRLRLRRRPTLALVGGRAA